MTKSLAVEWAKYGIRLNAVAPGEIPTEGMSKRLSPGEEPGARSRERNPMARPGEMSELQNLASFLMAPGQCDWLTGQTINMDGDNALATGGNFYELREWSDADWQAARAERGAEPEGSGGAPGARRSFTTSTRCATNWSDAPAARVRCIQYSGFRMPEAAP